MSIYEYKYRTTLPLRHRKGGGYYVTIRKEMVQALRVGEGYQLEIAVLRTTAPPVDLPEPEDESE